MSRRLGRFFDNLKDSIEEFFDKLKFNTSNEKKLIKKIQKYKYCRVLKYISEKNRTRNICIEAVKKSTVNMKFIPFRDKSFLLEAAKIDGSILEYTNIECEDNDIYKAALKSNPSSIKNVLTQTEELCKEAIQNGLVDFEYIRVQTPELVNLWIDTYVALNSDNSFLLSYTAAKIFTWNDEIALKLAKINPVYLAYTPIQTPELIRKMLEEKINITFNNIKIKLPDDLKLWFAASDNIPAEYLKS